MVSWNRIALCLMGCLVLAAAADMRTEIVPVVSARSAVTTLTTSQLVDIFLGKESRFPNGQPAIPIDQADGSAVRDQFYAHYAGRSPAELKAYWSKLIFTGKSQPPREAGSLEKLRHALYMNPYAIGYMRRSEIDGSLRIVEVKEER